MTSWPVSESPHFFLRIRMKFPRLRLLILMACGLFQRGAFAQEGTGGTGSTAPSGSSPSGTTGGGASSSFGAPSTPSTGGLANPFGPQPSPSTTNPAAPSFRTGESVPTPGTNEQPGAAPGAAS